MQEIFHQLSYWNDAIHAVEKPYQSKNGEADGANNKQALQKIIDNFFGVHSAQNL